MTAPADPVHSNIDARFPQAMERAARVRLMVFDVDGVLTDGRLLVGPEGEISKAFDTVSYTHLTLPTTCTPCRSRWSPYH